LTDTSILYLAAKLRLKVPMPVHTMLLSDKGVESLDMHHPYLIALSRAV
jgi:hypothetical protein